MKTPGLTEEALQDEVIHEVRAVREAIAAKFDFDLDKIFSEAKRNASFRNGKKWNAPPRHLNASTSE